MDQKKINQILRISKLYYELDLGQVEIAAKEGISKSTVSRLLKAGKDMGLVEVRIKEPMLSFGDLEAQLLSQFPLKRVTIVPDFVNNPQILLRDVCTALAEDLPRYLDDDCTLGVAWGSTLEMLSTLLIPIKRRGISVIQLSGGYSRAIHESSALEILKNFAGSVDGTAYVIPAPAMVDAPFIAEAIKQDSQVKRILKMAEHCQTAVFSVGNLARPSVIYEMGLLTDAQYRDMESRGCIGDVCSHFINAQGDIFDHTLDDRVVGASLDTIRAIPNKLLLASGVVKARVICAALRGSLVDSLYIDAPTAMEVLKHH
ncbi:MAG: sugar-binding domain-containing protein [Eubacterium aggregans]|uniref:sugar-binding transcriptional regulator n=1 Tax=Eubacterium aggregans TaxID=81409 RepID=UPI0023F0BDEB|nr:sugar-binding domain-containing protein [Eubacterium aggregans]MDD4692392.1 sugar-binding domain-containing protein [Eubacterium aggregans]MEA5073763.1 sugar-binding domain-containing protein [Eubacterium aggregans]